MRFNSDKTIFSGHPGPIRLHIICADDSYLNLEALRIIFSRLGLLMFCEFVLNGQQVVESCIRNYNSTEAGKDSVTIVIVDYAMPIKTGLQAVAEVRAFYSQTMLTEERLNSIALVSETGEIQQSRS